MVIVCPHWGTEYVYESTSYQDQWTNVFLEEGVDVVLGTHPHVIEPVKEFTRESDGHQNGCLLFSRQLCFKSG